VRYEQERKPSDSSLERLATLTGLPPAWFWCKPVTGILTFRPELPGIEYSHPQVRMKESALDRDWPKVLEIFKIRDVIILRCEMGGIVIAHSNEICIVLVGTHSVDTIRRVCAGLDINVEANDIGSIDFLNCWKQPQYQYLRKVLEAGSDLSKWVDQIELGKIGSLLTKYLFSCELQMSESDTRERSKENIEEIEKAILVSIITELEKMNLPIFNAKIKRVTSIIKDAPENWKFHEIYLPSEQD
jgi:hypothetical protein